MTSTLSPYVFPICLLIPPSVSPPLSMQRIGARLVLPHITQDYFQNKKRVSLKKPLSYINLKDKVLNHEMGLSQRDGRIDLLESELNQVSKKGRAIQHKLSVLAFSLCSNIYLRISLYPYSYARFRRFLIRYISIANILLHNLTSSMRPVTPSEW